MSNTKLFIPERIKVGYQNRKDTYTNKLAYVIYYDEKNKLRKEASWESWRDKKIDSHDFDNTPTEGFVLNKGVGGTRESYGWNARNEYIRVFDPRGFEFEISVANLLFILQECTSTKGKGLEGKFVYSWDGKDLVLLPVDSYEYQKSTEFTSNKGLKFSKKDLQIGNSYLFKNMNEYIYMGIANIPITKYKPNPNYGKRLPNLNYDTDYNRKNAYKQIDKRYVFYDVVNKCNYYLSGYSNVTSLKTEQHPLYNDASLLLSNEQSTIVNFEPIYNFITNKTNYNYFQYNLYKDNTIYELNLTPITYLNGKRYEKNDLFSSLYCYKFNIKDKIRSGYFHLSNDSFLSKFLKTESHMKNVLDINDIKEYIISGVNVTLSNGVVLENYTPNMLQHLFNLKTSL